MRFLSPALSTAVAGSGTKAEKFYCATYAVFRAGACLPQGGRCPNLVGNVCERFGCKMGGIAQKFGIKGKRILLFKKENGIIQEYPYKYKEKCTQKR